ncbi:riboflavin synthase [Schinkia azotoformans]|uniref:Riboflavin synthase n=1 Tax=Schinkia azotoformans LMG 9581 TaxID=1131731 RepID=K6DQU7_SCHAZ|nr:riboflavin synthase [Schinkia azotoformans]EKN63171.1 riboflavin synthase subunit alpha [Schinkia azotoformans LMG 9581]MEC1637278.1 riboflavin synthase [Schinkia azotoformans]MEC1943682.1 riboflavin synthase [Schinkia azotoformans]MED4352326.1 riboflavin synthase [Schinkia azotoformans]
MFTGIVEEKGTVKSITKSGDAIKMSIQAPKILEDVHLGDSIAVNGVCLTVMTFDKHTFSVDLMPETVKATSLRDLTNGSKVNLERAMAANGRFGGHFVSGHVDGIGTIISKKPVSNAVYYEIEVNEELLQYMLLKGSVTVDGTSLTIFGLSDKSFTISLIPHTLSETILGAKTPGDIVNIECDILGKYIEKFLSKDRMNKTGSTITEAFLEENGYK